MNTTTGQARPLHDAGSPNGARPTVDSWPAPLGEAAFHGLAGRAVRAIEPHTESDVAAVLATFLVLVGNQFGRHAGFKVGGSRHHTNLNVGIVGDTSAARKGVSYYDARFPVLGAFPDFKDRIAGGLSSAEGLIEHIRDPRYRRRKARNDEADEADEDGYITEIQDEGVLDKRCVVVETELSSVFVVMARQGNKLEAVLRQAWDGEGLSTMTRNPLTAARPHLSIIAHATPADLKTHMTSTHIANGFANRFLWILARQSKDLPEGGDLTGVDWSNIRAGLIDASSFANSGQLSDIGFDLEARERWYQVYPRLRGTGGGLLSAITDRGQPQTRRLAMVYALLDRSPEIELAHLEAALELWRYSVDSCRHLLGSATGDPLADEILGALREAGDLGLTRTEIRDLFNRHSL